MTEAVVLSKLEAGEVLAVRQRLGLTRAVLGRLAGLSEQTIRHVEQGNHTPHPQTLTRIRSALQKFSDAPSD